jgi:SAM-dependent methyltransferase
MSLNCCYVRNIIFSYNGTAQELHRKHLRMSYEDLPKRSIFSPNYLSRGLLEKALQRQLKTIHLSSATSIVLDLGSGSRQYEKLFTQTRYLAYDISLQSSPDVIGVGEALPFVSGSVDLIICIQVLEHVNNPAQVISEISRILKPGGIVILTTHGTMFYHPHPNDYWRWTQTGLHKIFLDNGDFETIHLEAVQGSFSTIGFLAATYLAWFGRKASDMLGPLGGIGRFLFGMLVAGVNLFSLFLDRVFVSMRKIDRPMTIFGVFLVRATRRASKLL